MKLLRWRTKVMIITIFGVFVTSFCIAMGIGKLREKIYDRYIFKSLSPLSSFLVGYLEHCLCDHAPSHFQDFIRDVTLGKDVRIITILDESGRIIFCNQAGRIGTYDSIFVKQPQRNEMTDFFATSSEGLSSLHHAYTVIKKREAFKTCSNEHDMKRISYLGITIDYTISKNIRKRSMYYDFISFFPLFIISVLSVVLIHRRVFQVPFSQITAGVKAITTGNLNTRIHIKTPGELTLLADGINQMALKLQKAIKTLSELHKQEIDRAGQLATVGELAASVAHEIKNPISGIGNALDIILDQYSDMKEKEIFQEMRAQIDRIYKTIENLMSFARPRKPRYRLMDLQQVLKNVVNFYREQFQKNNVILKETYNAEISLINGDEELLKQVFVNILINAFQECSQSKGEIDVRTENNHKKNRIIVFIKDNGRGIPGEQIDKIFKPFFTTKHKGSGLGLSLSHSIMQKHEGDIKVFSRPGEGAEFTLQFPLVGKTTNTKTRKVSF